ncbi:hypothetical protein WDZ92_33430, partial [Nostoc sp. NIES-2111]
MESVRIGIVGTGNVGSGTLEILAKNAAELEAKLGFRLEVKAVSSRNIATKNVSNVPAGARVTADWKEVATAPDGGIVWELVGGTGVARAVIEAALRAGKTVITANKELMALEGPGLQALALEHGGAL